MVRTLNYTSRRKLPKSLEETLSSVKRFQGGVEYEQDYLKVFERIKNTNPFSVLVFYESLKKKISLAKRKKLNPHIPERMLYGIARYVQFYFIPELEEIHSGAWIGSGYRSTQSVYALSLALLSEKKEIPTHILISDKQCRMKHVLSSRKLIVQPHEVTQTVNREVADKILKNTIKAFGLGDYGTIESVLVQKP